MQDELQNLNAWVQQVLKEVQEVKIQLNDLRGEVRGQLDDLRGHISRNDQTDTDTTRMVQELRTILETSRSETNNVKNTLENRLNHIEGRINEVRSISNEIKNKV